MGPRSVVVLHIFNTLEAGGAELRTLQLAEALEPHRVSFIYGLTGRLGGALEPRVRARGDVVHSIPIDWRLAWTLRRLAKERKIDAIHSHVSTASGVFLTAAWLVGIPKRIAHFRSDSDGHAETGIRRFQRWAMRWLIRRFATDVVAVSPQALLFAGLGRASTRLGRVVPSGIEVSPCALPEEMANIRAVMSKEAGVYLLLHVGRDNHEKNRVRAVCVLSALLRDHEKCPALLIFAGRMDEREKRELTELARSLRVYKWLRFVGELDNVVPWLQAADLTLVTSTREGLPGVVLESVSVGTPCVASDLPGVRWIASEVDGVYAVSLEETDRVWAGLIAQLLTRDDSKVAYAQARAVMEASVFSFDRALTAYAELWGLRP